MWLGLGLLLTIIGLIGIIVPGLPTTPIMILAAACFFKSSEKLYTWVIQNKYFGEHVRNFREGRCMPFRAKVTAIITMWIFVSIMGCSTFDWSDLLEISIGQKSNSTFFIFLGRLSTDQA